MNDKDKEEKEEVIRLVSSCVSSLMEHFDHVRIFVGKNSEDGTGDSITHTDGSGLFHAQMGQVEAWVRKEHAYEFGYNSELGKKDFQDKSE